MIYACTVRALGMGSSGMVTVIIFFSADSKSGSVAENAMPLALISSIYLKDVVVIYGVITLLLVVFYNAVVIPVSYRFGTGASRYFIVFFISVPIMFVYIFKIFDIDFEKILMSLELKTLYLLMWVLGAASLAVSVLITIRVIRKCLSGPGSRTAPEQLKGD